MASDTIFSRAATLWKHGSASTRELYLTLRPIALLVLGVASAFYGVRYLARAPWHHFPIVWLAAFGVAAYAFAVVYQDAASHWILKRWLAVDDAPTALRDMDEVQRASRRLPEWARRKYHERRAELRAAGDEGAPGSARRARRA